LSLVESGRSTRPHLSWPLQAKAILEDSQQENLTARVIDAGIEIQIPLSEDRLESEEEPTELFDPKLEKKPEITDSLQVLKAKQALLSQEQSSPPLPFRDRIWLILGIWTCINFFFLGRNLLIALLTHHPVDWHNTMVLFCSWYVWAFLTPAALWMA